MGLTRLNNNVSAIQANNSLQETTNLLQKNLERLSTGLAINRASDNAALLSISENLRSEINALNQAIDNTYNAVNLANTAEGALDQTSANLQRVRELVVQAGNSGVNGPQELQAIQDEIDSNLAEIDRVNQDTQFGTQQVFGQTDAETGAPISSSFEFQVGSGPGDQVELELGDLSTNGLGLGGIDISTQAGVEDALGRLDSAVDSVSSQRGEIGAFTNGLESTISNLGTTSENLVESESRVRDTDFASELTERTKNQLLLEAGIAVATQANISKQGVLGLLQ